jgi:hypothetical protein
LGTVSEKFDFETTVILKTDSNESDKVAQFIRSHNLSSEQFRSLTILSDKFITKSLDEGHLQDFESFDMGALFRIMTQNDQSFFSKESKSEHTKADTLSLDYNSKIDFVKALEPSEFCKLQDCVIHVFDNNLNSEAVELCNLLGAMVTE